MASSNGWNLHGHNGWAGLGHHHHSCVKHSGIFSNHKWSQLWFYTGSMQKCAWLRAAPEPPLQPCSGVTQNTSVPLLQHPGFLPNFSQAQAWCARGRYQNLCCSTRLCLLSAGCSLCFIQLVLFFFFSLLMEGASWNYRKLPLSNDLLAKPTITALSRPSERS